jgi:hypothetical protein
LRPSGEHLQSRQSGPFAEGIRPAPMRRRRRSSGSFPVSSLSLDELGCGLTEVDARAPSDSVEEFLRYRASNLALQDSLDVLGKRFAAGSGAPCELPVEPIRYVPHLNHLGHAHSISHAMHMRNQARLTVSLLTRGERDHGQKIIWTCARLRVTNVCYKTFESQNSLPRLRGRVGWGPPGGEST